MQGSRKPNIIFIMADDLGWGELGSYGNTFNETPNLDRLSAQGMRFTQAYAAAPVASPTRASIMTGQYPARVGITDFLPEDEKTDRWLDPTKYVTLNEALSASGYHTGIVGKWHLDTDFKLNKGGPKAHGFNEVIGTESEYIADGDYFFPYSKIASFDKGTANEYLTDRQCAEANAFITRNREKPFFLYLSLYSVHTRLEAPVQLVEKYKQKFDQKYGTGKAEQFFGANNVRHESAQRDNPWLAAMLESIDTGVGGIMKTLRETGLAENTIIVFFSDNGGAGKAGNNAHLRAGKTWLYEGGIREPLIVSWPGKIKGNTVNDNPVTSLDFYPTFLAAAGGKPTGGRLDGHNLMPLLRGGRASGRPLFWHYPSETGKWVNRMSSAVREGNYKLLEFYNNPRLELYDLQNDPSESHNLATDRPAETARLKKLLEDWKKEVNAEAPHLARKEKKKPGSHHHHHH
uniref:N-acetylgalactosamine-6-sulfatase n=1 Tax=Pedobacter yulinensis TaxID=2126353 RepID=UPI001E6A10E5